MTIRTRPIRIPQTRPSLRTPSGASSGIGGGGSSALRSSSFLLIAFLLVLSSSCQPLAEGFSIGTSKRLSHRPFSLISRSSSASSTQLHLVPLAEFQADLPGFFDDPDARLAIGADGTFTTTLDMTNGNSNNNRQTSSSSSSSTTFILGLAEEADLPDLSRFIVASFGADAIRLSQDLNAFERMLFQPASELLNNYSGIVAFAEVLSGLRSRLQERMADTNIHAPPLQGLTRDETIAKCAKDSLVLALAHRHTQDATQDDWHSDIIASVELRLEVADAKIPFTLPWLDRIERRAAGWIPGFQNAVQWDKRDVQPYLSTLCVDERFRSQGLGRALVHCVEEIAAYWGYSRIYLHVDPDNQAAYDLYRSEHYTDVGKRWNPFWAGESQNIGYFCKNLKKNKKRNDTAQRNKEPEQPAKSSS